LSILIIYIAKFLIRENIHTHTHTHTKRVYTSILVPSFASNEKK